MTVKYKLPTQEEFIPPRYDQIRRSMSVTRKKILPEIPKNFDEIFLPEEWTKTEGNQRFLLLQESGILLFVTDQNAKIGIWGWGKELQTCNPNFWTVIKKLLREESYSRLEIRRHGRGEPPPYQRRQQIQLNEKFSDLRTHT